jgi:hypothetical protein
MRARERSAVLLRISVFIGVHAGVILAVLGLLH